MRRRNPDPTIRKLERRYAETGDAQILEALARARVRACAVPVRGRIHVGRGGVSAARRLHEALSLGHQVGLGHHPPPFRAPHYTASSAAMAQEVALAAGGVLLLDEAEQVRRASWEAIYLRLAQLGPAAPVVLVTVSAEGLIRRLPKWAQSLPRRNHPKKKKNPDPTIRRLERLYAERGDAKTRLQLAKARIRAQEPNAQDVWLAFLHDLGTIVGPRGWFVAASDDPFGNMAPWGFLRIYSKHPSKSEAPGLEDIGMARMVVGLGPATAPRLVEAEMAPERYWIGGEGGPLDHEFTAEARLVLLGHMEGILL